MDPNRQPDYNRSSSTSDDRSRLMYGNARHINDARATATVMHGQYYAAASRVDASLKKTCCCGSMPANVMCNKCQTQPPLAVGKDANNWTNPASNSQHNSATAVGGVMDYNMNEARGNNLRQTASTASPYAIPTPGRSYWTGGSSNPSVNYASLENVANRNYNIEHQQNYKTVVPSNTSHSSNAINSYDRYTEEKYVAPKVIYSNSSSNSYALETSRTNATNMMATSQNLKTEQHIINPSNMVSAPKEQHPSPNYARKCPQLYAAEEPSTAQQQHRPTPQQQHHNLYMAKPPQFSSDKFLSIQQPTTAPYKQHVSDVSTDYRQNSSPHLSLIADSSRLVDGPLKISSIPPSQPKYRQIHDVPLAQQAQFMTSPRHPVYGTNEASRAMNYYTSESSKVIAPEMSPIIMKQTHTSHQASHPSHHYQYSRNSMPPIPSSTSQHHQQQLLLSKPIAATVPNSRDAMDYVKKDEELYDLSGIPKRSIYVNPYNTPPSSDGCCKESPSPYGSGTTVLYRGESPQLQPQINKYSVKPLPPETLSASKNSLIHQGTPPGSAYRSQPSYYCEPPGFKYEPPAHSNASSPAAAAAAVASSPSPSQILSVHHSDYTTQLQHHPLAYTPQHHLSTTSRMPHEISANASEFSTYGMLSKQQVPSNLGPIKIQPTNTTTHSNSNLQPPPTPSAAPLAKKNQTPKPNYKELINQAFIKRNTTSEDELNMQIIKRTLKVDVNMHPGNNNAVAPAPKVNNVSYRTEAVTPSRPLVIQDVNRTIKHESNEKPVSSPLDLSMRTVRTKADSTDYRYQRSSSSSSTLARLPEGKHSLPKVDFTPNFAIHAERSVIQSRAVQQPRNEQTPEVPLYGQNIPAQSTLPNHCPDVAVSKNTLYYEAKTAPVATSSTKSPMNMNASNSRPHLQITAKPAAPLIYNEIQLRPSVVETNPFAVVNSAKLLPKIEVKVLDRATLAVEQLPPETSIMALPKPAVAVAIATPAIVSKSAYNLACEENPNFLGRKRHLQEYAKTQEPANKSPRYATIEVVNKTVKLENSRPVDISVIAVNEMVVCSDKMKTAANECKQEPLTPSDIIVSSSMYSQAFPVAKSIKNEPNFSRIRTKGELKGFEGYVLNTPSTVVTKSAQIETPSTETQLSSTVIKQEPLSLIEIPESVLTDFKEEFNQNSLLDFSWSNTCNNFMEQLLTNNSSNKKSPTKRKLQPNVVTNQDKLPITEKLNFETTESNLSFARNNEVKSISQDNSQPMTGVQNKIGKHQREKLRLDQEKRMAARRPLCESSSESDNEIDKRKTERLKKPLKKNKNRPQHPQNDSRTNENSHHFSECGEDSSSGTEQKSNNKNATSNNSTSKPETETLQKQIKKETQESHNSSNNETTKKTEIVQKTKQKTNESSSSNDKNSISDTHKDKVQYNKNKLCSSKTVVVVPSKRLNSKISVNTMTRSKRKMELEIQLANSKVLRNDKIIRNSMTKIKRKYTRKHVNQQQALGKDNANIIGTRLRSQTVTNTQSYVHSRRTHLNRSQGEQTNKTSEASKGKKKQSDIFLEEYRYKRSLKIPPSLISIKHPSNHKIAASLPDIEKETESEEKTPTIQMGKKKLSRPTHMTAAKDQKPNESSSNSQIIITHRSIIDLLHSRVTSSTVASSMNNNSNKSKTKLKTSRSQVSSCNEASQQQAESTCALGDLLPTPKKEPTTDNEEDEDGKKRHFSIFDNKVLMCKTRTESKLQQKKEIIREIFVGDDIPDSPSDRPASAPPEMTQAKMTFEQKYEQFLQQMDAVNASSKLDRLSNNTIYTTSFCSNTTTTLSTSGNLQIKLEDGNESANAMDADNMSVKSGTCETQAHVFRHRRRPAKYLRRKGSSGFDYLRKKKKPTSTACTALASTSSNRPLLQASQIKVEKPLFLHKNKTEDDVGREIQKWVLNKGLGQSAIHKAARLGYIDVVVYCLDRLSMNPNLKDNAGYTPLHEACTQGFLEIARILLQYGANHSEAALSGIRPLHEASENDHEEIVRLLLSYGSDPLLATYSGQTPLMLATSRVIRDLLNNHLSDVQNMGTDRKPWSFKGPWEICDPSECGYDLFAGAPNLTCDMSRALRKSSVSSVIANKKQFNQYVQNSCKTSASGAAASVLDSTINKCAVVLNNINYLQHNSIHLQNDNNYNKIENSMHNMESDGGELFEFEEADILLPPLYLLKDEGSEKWVLLNDLCNLLKVKSKDTLLNKICPSSSAAALTSATTQKNLIRELKMSDFLEKATCLQLLCAGEKLNIGASKVVLIKYNESVRNLLGVKTILMQF